MATHRLVRLLIATVVVVFLRSEAPRACECLVRPGGACAIAFDAAEVFSARVDSVTYDSAISVRVSVNESFKGRAFGEVTLHMSFSSCSYIFEAGRSYLVYANRGADDRLQVGACTGTAPVEEVAADLVYLRGPFKQPATLGTVKGKVFKADNKPGSWGRHQPQRGVELSLEGNVQRQRTTSGSDGSFSFRVPPGRYSLRASVAPGFYTNLDNGSLLVLRDARGCAVLDAYVLRDGRISGRVLDANRAPVRHMTVAAAGPWTDGAGDGHALTDAEGRYEIRKLEPDAYAVGVSALMGPNARPGDPFAYPDGTGSPVKLGASQRLRTPDIVLPTGVVATTLEGTVVDSGGAPVVALVSVQRSGRGGRFEMYVPTDSSGRFRVGAIVGHYMKLIAMTEPSGPDDSQFVQLWAETPAFVVARGLPPFRITFPR